MGAQNCFIPHKTETYQKYSAGLKDDIWDNSVESCTIKSYPYKLIHCSQWAREMFEVIFNENIKHMRIFLKDKEEKLDKGNLQKLRSVQISLTYAIFISKMLSLKSNIDNKKYIHS